MSPNTTASSRTASVDAIHEANAQIEMEKGEVKPETTLREDVAGLGLEQVLARHGRVDLVPMPSDDPADPLNWPAWRKNLLLLQVSFHTMLAFPPTSISSDASSNELLTLSHSQAVVNVVQFFLYLFLGPETLFVRPDRFQNDRAVIETAEQLPRSKWYTSFISFKRWGNVPWSRVPLEIVLPLTMITRLPVLLPTFAYATAFNYCGVLLTVEIPSLVGQKYGFNSQQIGLQFVAAILGAVLGEPIAGYGSDKYMQWRTRRAKGRREAEMRLPIALPGFILSAVGIIIFGVQLQNTQAGVWSVTPLIGVGIALFGVQLITTVVYTYVVESQPPRLAPRVPLFVAFVRQICAFTGPFYFNIMFETLGAAKAAGILAALAGGIGVVFTIFCIVYGRRWRAKAE
ncbi:hypothetical protein P7C70_g1592, partial [Phenoliferia sp. Uapishka_3]